MNIEFLRDGEKHTVTLTPKYNEEEGRYLLGFNGYGSTWTAGMQEFSNTAIMRVRYSLRATIKEPGMLIQGKATKDDISGPIGVAQVIGEDEGTGGALRYLGGNSEYDQHCTASEREPGCDESASAACSGRRTACIPYC